MMTKLFFLMISIFIISDHAFCDDMFEINDIEIIGNGTTKVEALTELLPRNLPSKMSQAEIDEYSRRVKNIGIFDTVKVDLRQHTLFVEVHRKATLSPIIELSTGKTIQDTSAVLGLNEYDFLGNGTKLGAQASYNDRNFNFKAWIGEHNYRNNRWSRELELFRLSSSFRFNDSEKDAWTRNRLGVAYEIVSPFPYDSALLYEFQVKVYQEDFSNIILDKNLKSATYVGGLFEIIYDRYHWDDLYPHGFKAVMEMKPGVMTNGEFRGEAVAKLMAATPLEARTSFIMNSEVAIVNSGNVNHSLLIGSQSGVRGLDDSLYRTSALSYLNLEVRHALELKERVFVQPVLFIDMARFKPMDADGTNQDWMNALSTGAGVRIVPTGFTNLLFRVDLARLHVPSEDWLFQIGFSQYF